MSRAKAGWRKNVVRRLPGLKAGPNVSKPAEAGSGIGAKRAEQAGAEKGAEKGAECSTLQTHVRRVEFSSGRQ